jgi:hypothetical protein
MPDKPVAALWGQYTSHFRDSYSMYNQRHDCLTTGKIAVRWGSGPVCKGDKADFPNQGVTKSSRMEGIDWRVLKQMACLTDSES